MKEPTCTEGGIESGPCDTCGVETQQETPALGHDLYVSAPSVAPTCTETGLTEEKRCSNCNEVMPAEEIPAQGHKEVLASMPVAPTCTQPGYTESKRCLACLELTVEATEIPATGHRYDDDQDAVCNTCGEERVVEKACYTVTITVPAGAEVHMNGGVYTSADGKMRIENVEEGTYEVQVKKGGCLTHTITGVAVKADMDLGTVTLLPGDTNSDGMINIMDMGIFRQNFGKMGSGITNAYTDTNGDNMVNIIDMSVFRSNFGKTAKDCITVYNA